MFDLHNHILPGIDDGSADWDQSLKMARIAVKDGIEGVVCTPHWVAGAYDNRREQILERVGMFEQRLREAGIPLRLYPGAELRLDFDMAQKIEAGELMTLNDSRKSVLVELPEDILPQNLENFFWELQSMGLTPIISHPERNYALGSNPALLFQLVSIGVLTQITSSSLTGRFGSVIQQFTVMLLEHRMVHILASDAHGHEWRTPRLTKALALAAQIVGEEQARALVYENPKRIIAGERIEAEEPIPLIERKGSLWERFLSLVSPRKKRH